jgi:hypothetical protein
MTKKGPLGKAEIFYVRGHYEKQDVEKIAKDLDRALSLIRKQIAKFEEGQPKKKPVSGEKMARRDGVVVMTETASSMSDSVKARPNNKRPSHCTTKIKDE